MNIYADVIFLFNFIMDYFVLYICAKVMSFTKRTPRLLLSSSVGALYGVLSEIFTLAEPWCAAAVSALMIFTAFEIRSAAAFAKTAVLFYASGMLLGGIMTLLQRIFYTYKDTPLFKDGIDIWTYLLFAAVIFVFVVTAGRIFRVFVCQKAVSAEIYMGEKGKRVQLLCDSGNLLKDPYSGMPVVVVKAGVIDALLGRAGVKCVVDSADSETAAAYKLRFIPVKTVSGSALIPVVGALKIRLIDKRNKKELDAVVASDAFSSSDYGGNDGVIPLSVV